MATELAKAYVQIVPSAQGISGSISNLLGGEGTAAGEKAGANAAGAFGKKLKGALVGLGIGKLISDSIGNASEFETGMAKVSTLFKGTGAEFDALQGQVLNLSSTYGLAATTLAEAAYSAESAGVPMEDLGAMLDNSAKLAMAGFTDVDTALSATAKTMNAYGVTGADAMDKVSKVLMQTQNLGITTVGELGASLANVTPTAAAMGVSFEQVGAAMAQMTASGVPTAQATTQLRAAMTELGKAGTKADKAFRQAAKGTKYAGMSFQDAMANGANLGDVFGMMQTYADKSGKSMVDLWGSVEAGNAAMMIASDLETFNDNLSEMSTEADVVGEAYGKMSNTLGNSMNRLKESAKNFMTALFTGGDISASFDAMLGSLGDVGKKLIGWLTTGLKTLGENLPDLMKSLVDFAGGLLAALGEVDWIDIGTTLITGLIGGLGELGTGLAKLIGDAITSITSGEVDFSALGTSLLGGFSSILESLGTLAQTILDTIIGVLNPEGGENPLAKIFTTGEQEINAIDWAALGENVASAAAGLVNLTGEVLAGAFTGAEALISAIDWEALGTTVGNAANGLISLSGEVLAGAFTAAETLIRGIDWEALGQTAADAGNALIDLSGDVLAAGFTAAEALINGINWEGLGQTVASVANGLIDLTGDTLAGAFTAAETMINGIDWAGIGENAATAGNSLIALTGDVLAAGFTAAEALITGIDWAALGQTAADAGNGLINLTGEALSAGFTAAHALIEAIDWEGLGTTVGNVANSLVQFTGEALAAPFQAAHGILMGIDWAGVGSAIQSGLGDVWGGLTGFLGGALGGAGDLLGGVGDLGKRATTWLGDQLFGNETEQLKQAAEDLKTAMSDMRTAITDGKAEIDAAAKDVGTSIATNIKSGLTSMTMTMNRAGLDAGKTIGDGAKAGIKVKKPEIDTEITGVINGITSAFTDAGWTDAGSQISNGIAAGIRSSASAVFTAIQEVVTAALANIKALLGIASPSKVMRDQVGKWIPAGIAAGITGYAGMVSNAMDDLAYGMTSGRVRTALATQDGSISAEGISAGFDKLSKSIGNASERNATNFETQNNLLRDEISLLQQILEKTGSAGGVSAGFGRVISQSLNMYRQIGG